MDDLTSRAFSAYFRTAKREGVHSPNQPDGASGPVDHDGKTYVVLFNVNGTLAVYRVRTSGQLKRLRRWPKEVAEA